MQYAIENASSDWLARMDADDIMFPDRLKVQMDVIQQQPGFVFVGTDCALLTPFGHIFRARVLSRSITRSRRSHCWAGARSLPNPSTLSSAASLWRSASIDPEFAMDDIPLWFRMLTRGKGWEIAEPLHLYRLRPNSMSKRLNFSRQAIRARVSTPPKTRSLVHAAEKTNPVVGILLLVWSF